MPLSNTADEWKQMMRNFAFWYFEFTHDRYSQHRAIFPAVNKYKPVPVHSLLQHHARLSLPMINDIRTTASLATWFRTWLIDMNYKNIAIPMIGSQSNEKSGCTTITKGKLTSDFANKLYFDKFKYTKLLSLNYFKYTITKKIAK